MLLFTWWNGEKKEMAGFLFFLGVFDVSNRC